ncbi:hypothetical protein [Methylopila turkensis]|uniref:Uncharacterized protein n=1 Tax=Methylopila turkensis TaxID=1437816 RepID=A0A9W6JJS5_9HYPH|nr:hypothetical protein [Methylopila turkensis]GLK78322.1 hypothetical protein GCM10008174_00630 [Methylopila turkensis]
MLQHLMYEIVGVALFAAAILLIVIARREGGRTAGVLRDKSNLATIYSLGVTFLLAGGVAGIILGFST